MLIAARVQKTQVAGEPKKEPQFLDSHVGAAQRRVPPPRICRLDQGFQHVGGRALDAIAQKKFLRAGKPFHGGDKPQDEAVMRFQRRAGLTGAIRKFRSMQSSFHQIFTNKKIRQGASPLDPRGKEVRIHGASVRATRNPLSLNRSPVPSLLRTAVRRIPGMKSRKPPRRTRRAHSPSVHALPSEGAPT